MKIFNGAMFFVLSFGLAACAEDEDPEETMKSGCSQDSRVDEFSAGMEKTIGELSVTLSDFTPTPPERGGNLFDMMIRDAQGEALEGATVTVTAAMPDHGHGSTEDAVVSESGEPGEYHADPVYFQMGGYWSVSVRVEAKDGFDEEVMFGFCIES